MPLSARPVHVAAVWELSDIRVDLDPAQTEHPIITIEIETPAGLLLLMAAISRRSRSLTLSGLNMEGAVANTIGVANLLRLARLIMEGVDTDEIVVEGAVRTSGATPGRTPRPFRITRHR